MTKRNEIYKCGTCGNVVEVLTGAGAALVCCEKEMRLLKENTVDAAQEKHVPVVTTEENGILVNVGSVDHPMTDDHFIEWIEVIAGDTTYMTFLKPGDKPQACFPKIEGEYTVREHCNLHGVWKV